jgi:hypothetical protein
VLNLLIAVHDRLGDGGGTLQVHTAPSSDHVALTIEAIGAPDRPPLAPGGATLAQAVTIAAALLAPSGGRIVSEGARVTVTMPRAASV